MSAAMMGPTGKASGLKGTGYNQVSMPTLSPEQMNLFKQIFGAAGPGINQSVGQLSQMAGGGDENYWKQQEAPAMRQFEELQGNIASRFSGAGMGARKSSGFNNAQSGAAVDLSERLQSQRMGLQQNAISQLMGLYGSLMGTQTQENALIPKQKKWWEELAPALAGGIGQLGGTFGGIGLGKKIFG
jgi:hypothetical protein